MNLKDIKYLYFIGIGGIGMSAIARYFKKQGFQVSGYDRSTSPLIKQLNQEGVNVSFEDQGDSIGNLLSKKDTLVVYTPAIPTTHKELNFFKEEGYTLLKRAEVLGAITKDKIGLAVAGTHGKTTTSTLLAHVLQQHPTGCNAFLGGISTNYNSNLILNEKSPWVVIEADEFDRSFHQLHPFASIVTSTDADHLDIYKDHKSLHQAFEEYTNLIDPEGVLIHHHEVLLSAKCKKISYGVNTEKKHVDFKGTNIRVENGIFLMDVETPNSILKEVALGCPGIHNAENALAVMILADFMGLDEMQIRKGLATFKGVKRRFEYHVLQPDLVYIDDYAHHPTAINSLIQSVKLIHPDLKITGVFQPHLFSRTQDFMDEFAKELSALDEVILLPIYPAREMPIEGVNSEVLLNKINSSQKAVFSPSEVLKHISKLKKGVVLTIGAGDIDQLVTPIKEQLL